MKAHWDVEIVFRVVMAVLVLAALGPAAGAEEEVPWGEAELFFELNDTCGDLGIHAAIDGEPWKELEIEAPNGRELLDIRASSRLKQQGMTQLLFESAEPTFEELTPEEFFARFPEGVYEIGGETLDGVELESEVELSHVMAAPPSNIRVNGELVPEDCDVDPGPTVSNPVTITWDPVTTSHPEIGASGPVEVVLYEFVLETDDFKLTAGLPPSITEFDAPAAYLALSEEWKLEIIVRTETHNNTATESCFVVE